jgi:uncharacterized protein YprB with RNaseH-like and TPR domain
MATKAELVRELFRITSELGEVPNRDKFVELSNIPRSQWQGLSYTEIRRAAGYDVAHHMKDTNIQPWQPRIALIDIETAYLETKTWGIGDQRIALNQIIKDWSVLSWTYKLVNSEEIIYRDTKGDPRNDEAIIREIHKLLDESDVVIAHNAAFDMGKLRARFLYYDLPVNRPFRVVCTYKIARKHFKLTSNKLEYLARYLKVIEKYDHGKFPGMKLWDECLADNPEAWKEMEDYNVRDVIALEAIYLKLRKYDSTIRFNVFTQDNTCECGSEDFRNLEPVVLNSGVFKAIQCVDCSKVYRSKQNLIDSTIRKHLNIPT